MYGFLINVFNRGEIYEKGGWFPTPITYKGHVHIDPAIVPPYCYGDHPENKSGLKSFQAGDALIFHTTLADEHKVPNRYIIGGFQARMVKCIKELTQEELTIYNLNPHIQHEDINAVLYYHAVPLFPKEVRAKPSSPFLKIPLLFDKQLADDLDLNIKWGDKYTPYQKIAWSTRAVRKINENHIQHLINETGRKIWEK